TACLTALALAACQRGGGDNSDDPRRPGLAFAKVPAAANVNGRFELFGRLNDDYGNMTDDSETEVTIQAVGGGTLHGTTSRRAVAGQVIFDDLVYDRWEGINLTLSADGFRPVTTREALLIRPLMRFVKTPPTQIAAG